MLKVMQQSLEELEAMVELSCNPTEQALALWAIRKRGLWKIRKMPPSGYSSFERYMKEVWHSSLRTGLFIIGRVDDQVGQYKRSTINAIELINFGRAGRKRKEQS